VLAARWPWKPRRAPNRKTTPTSDERDENIHFLCIGVVGPGARATPPGLIIFCCGACRTGKKVSSKLPVKAFEYTTPASWLYGHRFATTKGARLVVGNRVRRPECADAGVASRLTRCGTAPTTCHRPCLRPPPAPWVSGHPNRTVRAHPRPRPIPGIGARERRVPYLGVFDESRKATNGLGRPQTVRWWRRLTACLSSACARSSEGRPRRSALVSARSCPRWPRLAELVRSCEPVGDYLRPTPHADPKQQRAASGEPRASVLHAEWEAITSQARSPLAGYSTVPGTNCLPHGIRRLRAEFRARLNSSLRPEITFVILVIRASATPHLYSTAATTCLSERFRFATGHSSAIGGLDSGYPNL